MKQFTFKDTTTTFYTINADNQEKAIEILDRIWWIKQLSIRKFIENKILKVSQKIWIEFESNVHECKEFIFGDDMDKKYCVDCWKFIESDFG
tara:strand:+ start:5783 stop:6058 length:276 start_codon:yes stop_codon:yes gene_type:complete